MIGSDVWIGDGAVIMPSITIAPGCVIGANTTVTKDTEPYGIYVGSPARKVRARFSQEIADRLLQTQWWDIDRQYLASIPTRNVFEFLESVTSFDEPALANFQTYRLTI